MQTESSPSTFLMVQYHYSNRLELSALHQEFRQVVEDGFSGREDLDEIKQHIKNGHDKLLSLFKHCVTFSTFCSSLHEVADENFTSTVKTGHHVWVSLDELQRFVTPCGDTETSHLLSGSHNAFAILYIMGSRNTVKQYGAEVHEAAQPQDRRICRADRLIGMKAHWFVNRRDFLLEIV